MGADEEAVRYLKSRKVRGFTVGDFNALATLLRRYAASRLREAAGAFTETTFAQRLSVADWLTERAAAEERG